MAPTSEVSLPPKPVLEKEVLEKVSNCQILSYTIVDGSKPGDNYMSVLYTVSAEVIPSGRKEPETRHYLLKCFPRHPARQQYLSKTNMFYNEMCFYTIWTKELIDFQSRVCGLAKDRVFHPALPPCAGGTAPDFTKSPPEALTKVYDPAEVFIMMTDLRKTWGFEMANKLEGLNYDQWRLAMLEYAKLHALSWAYRKRVEWDVLDKYPFLKMDLTKEDIDVWKSVMDQNVETAVTNLDLMLGKDNHLSLATRVFHEKASGLIDLFVFQKVEDEEKMWELHRDPKKALVDAGANDDPWRIIMHGDTWCNNMLFKSDNNMKSERICFVDFQLVRPGCPTLDLVYMTYTSTTQELRKAHLDDMLDLYVDRFNEVCFALGAESLPNFTKESFKRRFHRSKPIGYMMAVLGFPLMLIETGEETNLDESDANIGIEEVFKDALDKGNAGPAYKERLLGVAQDLYSEGVI